MSANVAQPYIGITGISNPWEIETITGKWFSIFEWGARDRLFMNGILVSSKSLSGEEPSNPKLYPSLTMAHHLMIDDPRVLNTVHFNISGLSENPAKIEELPSYLRTIAEELPRAQAIQLNLAWPAVEVLQAFRLNHPQKLILQISAAAYGQLDNQPDRLAKVLEPYVGAVDYILLDPSGGTGQPFDPKMMAVTLKVLAESQLPFAWGAAGGLGPRSLGGLRQLIEVCPDLSWDAQGRLRDDHDRLSWADCYDFLKGSLALARLADKAGS